VLTQEDEEVLWWLLQRNAAAAAAAAAAAPAGMPAGIDDLEPEEGCLGAGASPGAAQELCLNYDDFTQAGGRNALGTLHSAEPLLGWAAGDLLRRGLLPLPAALAVQVAAECREAIGPVADLYFQAGGAACCMQECPACCLQECHSSCL
jgi:hypothetical protein